MGIFIVVFYLGLSRVGGWREKETPEMSLWVETFDIMK